jgi:hypothetical protein
LRRKIIDCNIPSTTRDRENKYKERNDESARSTQEQKIGLIYEMKDFFEQIHHITKEDNKKESKGE